MEGRKRQGIPRSLHGEWHPNPNRADPWERIAAAHEGRDPAMLPLRIQRMASSPFAFLRATAGIMAADLADTPTLGVVVQACGDAHILNFGGVATPERRLVFDLNDFDETYPAPWEWDLKRLVVSVWVAAQDLGLRAAAAERAVLDCGGAYRLGMNRYARLSHLDRWYAQLDAHVICDHAPNGKVRRYWQDLVNRAYRRTTVRTLSRIARQEAGMWKLIPNPPILPPDQSQAQADYWGWINQLFDAYRQALAPERQFLLQRYRLVDAAPKVTGVSSIGIQAGLIVLQDERGDPLLLQYKEARPSVWAAYGDPLPFQNEGERIVVGQRLIQAASDLFLGWTRIGETSFYLRQCHDGTTSIRLETMSAQGLAHYAQICGLALARAHARTGDPHRISAYVGRSEVLDQALLRFAQSYAKQVHQDYQQFRAGLAPCRHE